MTLLSVQQCIDEGEQLFDQHNIFFGHGTDNAADEALWLVFHYLGLSWDSDSSVLSDEVAPEDYANIQQLFRRRVDERTPAAYLTGEAWFAGYPFIVTPDVLIPRSPIAELIEHRYQPWVNTLPTTKKLTILDLCTGSGCIGIASAFALPDADVILSDISPEAIAIANKNIQKHGMETRIKALESDLFSALSGQCFDLIVTNPPYVDAADLANMPAEYQAEPALALASGDDGLDFTRRLLQQAPAHLNDQGVLVCEVGNSWVNVESAFPAVPFFWLAFERGGHGVFVMTKEELLFYQDVFKSPA